MSDFASKPPLNDDLRDVTVMFVKRTRWLNEITAENFYF